MQVTNQMVSRQLNDHKASISSGEIGSVLIKDRLGGNEATVLFKGQEFSARFDGQVPSSDRLLAEVVDRPESGRLVLREASASLAMKAANAESLNGRLLKAGFDPGAFPELKDAVRVFDAKGIQLTKDEMVTLQKFLTEAQGKPMEKMETVNALAQKNLPMAANHLNAIHTALHGMGMKDALRELAGEIKVEMPKGHANSTDSGVNPKPELKNIEQIIRDLKNGNVSLKDIEALVRRLDANGRPEMEQLKQEITKALQIHAAGTDRVRQGAIADGEKLQRIAAARLREALEFLTAQNMKQAIIETPDQDMLLLKSLLKDVQKEASLTKILDIIEKVLDELKGNKTIDITQLKASFEKATQMAEQGRELSARKVVAEAMNQLEKDHPSIQKGGEQLTLTEAEQYAINESLQSLALQSKSVLVMEITQKLSQLAIDFKKIKQEITKSLDHVALMLDKGGSKVNARQTLDAAINKLDNAILKSNFMLYTDMLTEKKMLTASSRLSEARNLLAKGEYTAAITIVKDVKATLDQIIFKPSNTRVQHFVNEQSLLRTTVTSDEQLAQAVRQAVRPMPDQDYSARQVFESVRRLGLTHENDAANSLVFGSKGDQGDLNQNLKARLIQMAQDADGYPKAEQTLANLTGQQLLNKQDSSGMQNLFLQMPFLLNQEMENIKVFINSQKSGEKIDWENCSLYFVLETKKLGEVGIQVTAQNRNISITFNSKKDGLDKLLDPMTEISKERLQEIGYKLEALKTKKPAVEAETESTDQQTVKLTPAFTEKGYNFTI
ncbi:hypothetical protein [Mesobacillus jeotgali]|uniref:hypothetical protein n=1 Tax=Mesobacillus jeotgali TaxID=129985 RepID=UPI00177DF5DC|nr:hypothetical protein [Mesobacillus jeotgali]UYZ21607.1 hypothetical protein FOF60_21810 [Mesobacillus jeotgali]